MQFKGNLLGFNNLGSGNQGSSYICSILLNARWKSILIEFKVKLEKKIFPAHWYRKQLEVLHKSEELIECIFPVTLVDTVTGAQASLLLSGAFTTIILQPFLFLDGRQSTPGGNECSAEIKARRKWAPGSKENWRDIHSPAVRNFNCHVCWNSVDSWNMIKGVSGSEKRENSGELWATILQRKQFKILVSNCCYNKLPPI